MHGASAGFRVYARGYGGPGAEPLTIGEDDFVALFAGRKTPIKAALLNQSLLHGVGNIYADESLFRAGIRPTKHAGRISRKALLRLRLALVDVLHHAIQLGGSSVSDYVDADGVRGFFQLEHKVYGRAGETCKVCERPLKKVIVGGRTTILLPRLPALDQRPHVTVTGDDTIDSDDLAKNAKDDEVTPVRRDPDAFAQLFAQPVAFRIVRDGVEVELQLTNKAQRSTLIVPRNKGADRFQVRLDRGSKLVPHFKCTAAASTGV